MFHRRAEIPANQASPANRASPPSRAGSVCRDLGTSVKHTKGPITWAGLARLAGLAWCTEMTVQPGITWGEPARLQLNLEAVVWKYGYIKEQESSAFTFANPLFWRIIFSFT